LLSLGVGLDEFFFFVFMQHDFFFGFFWLTVFGFLNSSWFNVF
jgi:hypothetical protein